MLIFSLFIRIGMHLLFYGHEQVELLETKKVEEILREQSIKQGKLFDDPKSAQSIEHFVKTYSLQLDELLVPDLSQYKTFNEFFYRCTCHLHGRILLRSNTDISLGTGSLKWTHVQSRMQMIRKVFAVPQIVE